MTMYLIISITIVLIIAIKIWFNTKKPIKIMFAGKMHAGKTTSANIINMLNKVVFDETTENFKFAQGIMDILDYIDGNKTRDEILDLIMHDEYPFVIKMKIFEALSDPEKYKFPDDDAKRRKAKQYIGTDVFRHIDNRVWVLAMKHAADKAKVKVKTCDDLRYKNEEEYGAKDNWYIVKVHVKKKDQVDRLKSNGVYTESALEHESERDFHSLKAHFDVMNFGEKIELMRTIYKIYKTIRLLQALDLGPLYFKLKNLLKDLKKIWFAKKFEKKLDKEYDNCFTGTL